jgi:hypothetical protein
LLANLIDSNQLNLKALVWNQPCVGSFMEVFE